MRVNKSVEQAIYVVVMLELEAGGRPLKSSVMSRLLGVSDSYLKKILRKMVVTGIVESSASRGGGHSLCRPASEVTLADIVDAVDEMAFVPGTGHLAQNLFGDDPHVGQAERKVQNAFTGGFDALRAHLAQTTVEDLLDPNLDRGVGIDWEARLAGRPL